MNIKAFFAIFKNMKLRSKLLLSYIIIAFIPIILISYFIITKSLNMVLDQTDNINRINFEQLKNNLKYQLDGYITLSNNIISDKILTNYIESDYSESIPYFDKFQDYTKLKDAYNSKISTGNIDNTNIAVYTTNNTILTDYRLLFYVDEDIRKEQWYKDALVAQGNIVLEKTYKNSNNQRVFAIERVINPFSKGKYTNILKVEIPENNLYKLIEKDGINKWIYLLDEKGYVISSTQRDSIGANVNQIAILKDIDFNNRTDFTKVVSGNNNIFFGFYNNNNAFQNWKVVEVISSGIVLKNMHEIELYSVFIFAAFAVFAIILIFAFSATLTKRLRLLVKNMSKIKDGKFEVLGYLEENDEIGELSRSFKKMIERIDELIKEVYVAEMHVKDLDIKKKEAEINALQSQMNPHFLFNTMDSIRMSLVKKQDMETASIIYDFAKLLRKSLEWKNDMITLGEEISFVETYLKVQKFRYWDKFEYNLQIDEALFAYKIPKFALQPIVENAIYHGLEMKMGKGILKLFAENTGDCLKIIVQDDGIGMDEEKLSIVRDHIYNEQLVESNPRVGMRNVHQRLRLYYGEKYGIIINSELKAGTRVELILPLMKSEVADHA